MVTGDNTKVTGGNTWVTGVTQGNNLKMVALKGRNHVAGECNDGINSTGECNDGVTVECNNGINGACECNDGINVAG